MELTKEQAVAEHRKMWRWIAEETEKRREIVKKADYIKKYFPNDFIFCDCFCCEYANQQGDDKDFSDCGFCPIDWNSNCSKFMCLNKKTDTDSIGLYMLWENTENWKEAAKLAEQIAELPERF